MSGFGYVLPFELLTLWSVGHHIRTAFIRVCYSVVPFIRVCYSVRASPCRVGPLLVPFPPCRMPVSARSGDGVPFRQHVNQRLRAGAACTGWRPWTWRARRRRGRTSRGPGWYVRPTVRCWQTNTAQ
jgi:hypothetical protein